MKVTVMDRTNQTKNTLHNALKTSLVSALSLAALAGITAGTPTQANAADLDQKTFSKAMDEYLKEGENVEKVSTAIQTYFNKKREEEARSASQAEEKRLEEQFKNPVKIDVGDSPFKGPKNAKVTIVEFSDFQCPYCSRGKTIMEEVLAAYPKDVKVVFKHLPLDFHAQAVPASKATIAAGKQGKFWEMHDKIFDNQAKLADDFYAQAAKELGLNVDKFNKDFSDPKTEEAVKKDVALAKSLGVQGTPNFFVNGVNLRGAYPLPEFQKIIDKWLEKKK